jgi:predicted DNA-binding protein (MmcQ/YjbR family)
MAGQIGLLGEIGTVLNGLPGVFSTVQWGGRAYKVPGPGSGRSKSKLLAFVSTDDAAQDVFVSFKLKPPRAREVVDRHDWIEPHSFRTLAPSGWLTARVHTKRQLAILADLLHESHALYAPAAQPEPKPVRQDDAARHIDQVMNALRASGWSPPLD